MAYNSTTQKITAPVSVSDVQLAIGASTLDVGTLCKHENVNKWAKYKPLKVAQVGPLTSTARTTANHGIKNIPTWSYLSKMATFLFSDNRGSLPSSDYPSCGYSSSIAYWDYDKPTGTSQSPYRLTDFSEYPVPSSSPKGYYHGAQAPIASMTATSIQISPEGVLHIRFPLGASDACTLTFADLTLPDAGSTAVGSMYFGVLLKQTSGSITSRTYAITQATTISQISGSYAVVEIQLTASDTEWAGTWKIFPIISNVAISTMTTQISNYDGNYFFAPLPYHSQGITISIEYAKFSLNITNAFRATDGQNVTVSTSITNEASESKSYRVTYTVYDSSDNVLATYDITGTLAAGASATRTSDILIPNGQQQNATRLTAVAIVTDSGVIFKQSTSASAVIGNAPEIGGDLTAGYTELAYLESSGTQYIDTGYTLACRTDDVEIDFYIPDNSTNRIFGARTNTSSRVYTLDVSSNNWRLGFNAKSTGYSAASGGRHVAKIDHSGGVLKIDSSTLGSNGNSTATTPYNAALFAIKASGGMYYGSCRIYEYKLFRNGTLIQHLIPAMRDSDSVVGMYDIVGSSGFLTNAGSGTFSYGTL